MNQGWPKNWGSQKPLCGVQLDRSHPLGQPIFYVPLNEYGGTVVREAAGGRRGLFVNSPTWDSSGVKFVSTATSITFSAAVNLAVIAHTVIIRARIASMGGHSRFFCAKKTNNGDLGHVLYAEPTGTAYYHSGTTYGQSWTNTVLPTNEWFAICATKYPNAPAKIYINGIQQATITQSTGTGVHDTLGTWSLGDPLAANYSPNGTIAWAGVWSRVLTDTEIMQIHTQPYCMFDHSSNKFFSYNIIENFSNLAQTTLTSNINETEVLSLEVNDGSKFPNEGSFRILINNELIKVEIRLNNVFYGLTRSCETGSSIAASHVSGTKVTHVVTTEGLTELTSQNTPRNIVFGINNIFTVQTASSLSNPIQILKTSTLSTGCGIVLTAPTGSAAVFKVCKNTLVYSLGTEVASFSVAATTGVVTYTAGTVPANLSFIEGDYLTFFCTSVGSTIAGASGNFTLTLQKDRP